MNYNFISHYLPTHSRYLSAYKEVRYATVNLFNVILRFQTFALFSDDDKYITASAFQTLCAPQILLFLTP
jgi:hypothetical protein